MVDVNWRPVFWNSEETARATIVPYVKVIPVRQGWAPHRDCLTRLMTPQGVRLMQMRRKVTRRRYIAAGMPEAPYIEGKTNPSKMLYP